VVLSRAQIVAVVLGLILISVQGASAVDGPAAANANGYGFKFGIVRVSVYSVAQKEQWVCTGTLVAETSVLTSTRCAGPAGDTSVQLLNTQSSVQEVTVHPSLDLAILHLSTRMTPANYPIFPEIANTRPANGAIVHCYGFGGGNNTNLREAPFSVGGSGNNYTVDRTWNMLQDGDEGGPCYDNLYGSNGVLHIVGVISTPWNTPASITSGVGVSGIGAAGEAEKDTVGQWVADITHLNGLKLNPPLVWWHTYALSLINKHSNKAFDVANGSLLPNTAVNQYHLNGGLNQNWYLEDIGPYPYTLKHMVNGQSGKCLDVDANNQLRQSTCGSTITQQFQILATSETNYVNIISYNGLMVDVPWSSTNDGTRLQVYPGNGGDNQIWYCWFH
jgi:hypothetical protein